MARYDGPIIDAHHHLWDLGLGRHPWLASSGISALGDIAYMRRDYLPADYAADAAGQDIVASVCVEALWDRTRDPVEETVWLEGLEKPGGIAARYVAYADLTAPDAEAIVARQASFPAVAGLRETVRWHPDPAKRWTEKPLLDDPAWRRGLKLLAPRGLLLELLMNPYQAADVARLAAGFPEQTFVVDHCGSPVDRDPEGRARWRQGLVAMAAQPNVAIKISNYAAYGDDRSPAGWRATLMPCIEAFGTSRTLFGSDYPVARRNLGFTDVCERLKDMLEGFSASEQRAILHDNARRIYRMD